MRRSSSRRVSAGMALKNGLFLGLLVLFAYVSGNAQQSTAVSELLPLQAGVTLPVRLGRSLQAGKVQSGTKIVAKTTQRVPVGEHLYLNHGAALYGEVVTSVAGDGTAAKPSILAIRFTQLRYRKQTIPVVTGAIAIANFTEVGNTFLPTTGGADRGNASEASWTTTQVGGDEVARSGWVGDVIDKTTQKVGYADYYGVYALPTSGAEGARVALPRAIGVFSPTASGLYGFDEGTSLRSAGGLITLTRVGKKLLVRNGDNILLEVLASQ
jgi:hypothetical protein